MQRNKNVILILEILKILVAKLILSSLAGGYRLLIGLYSLILQGRVIVALKNYFLNTQFSQLYSFIRQQLIIVVDSFKL